MSKFWRNYSTTIHKQKNSLRKVSILINESIYDFINKGSTSEIIQNNPLKDNIKVKINKSCNFGYKLVNGKCRPDFFIKIIYLIKQKEQKIELIKDYSDILHIYIESKKIKPSSTKYLFKEEGYHIVSIQFKESLYYKSKLFENNKYIISVTFSDFDEYMIDLPLNSIFAGCTNLTSVDFSNISYIYESNMEHMFDGCINLNYVNLNNLQVKNSVAYMFRNCHSFTSINLSKFNVKKVIYLNNMFENCFSLQNINIKGFEINNALTMESIFKNCYSLKYIDLSDFKPYKLNNIHSSFYNCTSLTNINFIKFNTSELNDMGYLFYNCSSLKNLDLTYFDTKKVKYMKSSFEGCINLNTIKASSNFKFDNVEKINSMFKDCHSLSFINFDIKITNKVPVLSSLFSNCYSLTSINMKYFDTSNVYNYSYMFHNCYNIKYIDISNFIIKRKADLKGMFSGCYKIASINFSNVKNDYYKIDKIFYDCPNLNYVNISFLRAFPYIYSYRANNLLFNKNISGNGTLILNEKYYQTYIKKIGSYPSSGWNLILTN